MKTYKYIALAALVLGFAACSQDYDFTPNQEDIVQIVSANIATEVKTRVNTLDDGTQWENNDQILLVNNSRDNKYVRSIVLNGNKLETPFFTHQDIVDGGTLELTMGSEPLK